MDTKKLEQTVSQLETYVDCWKQLNHYIHLAREKRFDLDDEAQFLEYKCVVTQELESILALMEVENPSKEEIHTLIMGCPSIRALSLGNENDLNALENNWHRIYIAWHSILGQLKAAMRQQGDGEGWSLFKK